MAYLENNIQYDPVRPGEQWFFYWKTSASLWESRIVQSPQDQTIFIPLYWGHHAESATEWDFGKTHPDRDLLRLSQLLTQHSRRFCWLLPLSPAPFLPNGGVPALAARTLSISRDGVHLASIDDQSNLHKMYSFFEPKVFQSYSSFVHSFGNFLTSNRIQAPLWGTNFQYHQDSTNVSFLDDFSLAFEQGFSRYLKKNLGKETELTDPRKEAQLKLTFMNEVRDLFKTTAENAISPFWMGALDIVCLGAGPKETIQRALPGGRSQLKYTEDLFRHFSNNEWISSSLLTQSEKKEPLTWVLQEHFGPREIDQRYRYEVYKGSLSDEFRPYGLIEIFSFRRSNHFLELGLISYLETHFRWLYQNLPELIFTPDWIDANHDRIKVFLGEELTNVTFAQLLKLFLMGQKVLLDVSGLGEGLDKKLQIFLLENNIKSQSVNFMTVTQICELGEGRLILFEGNKLKENPARENFWANIFHFFNLEQPDIQMDNDVFSLWRIRATFPHELSYLDVRRVNIYNPTSYKKSVSIRTQKHFAFMKMIDPNRAVARSTPQGVEIELLPSGKIALDFGHYQERT